MVSLVQPIVQLSFRSLVVPVLTATVLPRIFKRLFAPKAADLAPLSERILEIKNEVSADKTLSPLGCLNSSITLLIVLVISYAGGVFSGKTVFYEVKKCTYSDAGDRFPDGKDFMVRGTIKLGTSVLRDYCDAGTGYLIEYYCTSDGLIDTVEEICQYGCSTGRCRDFPRQ